MPAAKSDRVSAELEKQATDKAKAAGKKGGRPKGAKDTKPRKTRSDKGTPKPTPIPEPAPAPAPGEQPAPVMSVEAARRATRALVKQAGGMAGRLIRPEWKPTTDEEAAIGDALFDCALAYGWLTGISPWWPLAIALGGYGMRAMTEAEQNDAKAEAAKKKADAGKKPPPAPAPPPPDPGAAPLAPGGAVPDVLLADMPDIGSAADPAA